MDFKKQRDDVVHSFEVSQAKLVELLEENLLEPPLHQLSLAEFNLHLEHKKERNKQVIGVYHQLCMTNSEVYYLHC